VIEPQCLLLDEPLSNLDAKLRLEMRTEIRRICKEAGLTAVYVTHDQKEALSISDRLAVMREGAVEQVGTPEAVYRTPVNSFVAGFVGEANFFRGRVVAVSAAGAAVETPCGVFVATAATAVRCAAGETVTLCVRPESVRFERPPDGAPNVLRGRYRESAYLGEVAQRVIDLPLPDGGVQALKAFELNPLAGRDRDGEPAEVWVPPDQVIAMQN
jgi:iron(III) transport system ATP-binding protein